MEAAASVAATRGGSLPMSSSSTKEWRAISDHHQPQNAGEEDLERSKLGQSDERTIYEVQHEREPVDVDFCSITVDGGLDNDMLQQRLHSVARKREELQQVEIDLRAQVIARSEIMEMQRTYDAQMKEHVNNASKLQEQVSEREQVIRELERKIEEKDRELHAIKLEKEASWAKEDILREQDKELATFRRERDHSEAERAQRIKQIHDLQEHIQEKERQLVELQEQYRASQETILYKDEQLRDTQAWVTRVQEMDALQSSANQSLQAELRERTEQFNQLWINCQRQFAEMERLHLHAIQQLQLELADARERNGTYTNESRILQTNSKDTSQLTQNNERQGDGNVDDHATVNTGALPNGASDNVPSAASVGNSSCQNDHVASVPVTLSMLGMHTYLPPGQVTALHSFVMHQQGLPHSVPAHVPQSPVGHFFSMPPMSSIQQWLNNQAASEVAQVSAQNQIPPSQSDQNLASLESKYEYEMSINGQGGRSDYLDHSSQGSETVSSSTGKAQVYESIDTNYLSASQSEQTLQQVSSQFHDALRLSPLEESGKSKEEKIIGLNNNGLEIEISTVEQPNSAGNISLFDASVHSPDVPETTISNGTDAVWTETLVSTGRASVTMSGKTSDIALLDEKALLACIVRTIPAGGRIRISSTLPNRLGKMLAPLHWHDYKKMYGKLDDFVAGHSELFVIEGDYIQLREGAQEMIAATAAVAKVAAAAAAKSPYFSVLPSVAVTPKAQPNRLKKVLSIDSNHVKQHNGVCFGAAGNIKILSKSKDSVAFNGASFDTSSVSSTESKASVPRKPGTHVLGKQQSRPSGGNASSRT